MPSDAQPFVPKFPDIATYPEGAEVKTYKGACHCRKFTYEFDYPGLDVKKPISCNCTFCTKVGSMNVFGFQTFFRLGGEPASWDELSKFKAKLKPVTHHFCPGCGCYMFWTVMGIVGVNVRMFEGIEVEKIIAIPVDGRKTK
ncbi:uncharacterized protein FOMMEDRAFT_139005 [Fomitiporia mediterranea MF3/22]|uniref:uncharacterized protein n=1 Tax=Fomitiporia mediterranea (strain MF3/22) TaxID=694068 RepID=UPI0004409300|nr:uncharacterized protein FOMMEDRAFT_139005 [Fomitiporia mediterranea MF3/22]EJD05600.1 hypothetical protein FOMMEDRAFT_139005 [Fomitiporia mediterranea MF3/22]